MALTKRVRDRNEATATRIVSSILKVLSSVQSGQMNKPELPEWTAPSVETVWNEYTWWLIKWMMLLTPPLLLQHDLWLMTPRDRALEA
jgi:hypothetical protein